MSLAQLQRDVKEIRRQLSPESLHVFEAWLRWREGDDGEEHYRGCLAPNYEATPFEGITLEALRDHWREIERRGYRVTALIFADANLTDIYHTPESVE